MAKKKELPYGPGVEDAMAEVILRRTDLTPAQKAVARQYVDRVKQVAQGLARKAGADTVTVDHIGEAMRLTGV